MAVCCGGQFHLLDEGEGLRFYLMGQGGILGMNLVEDFVDSFEDEPALERLRGDTMPDKESIDGPAHLVEVDGHPGQCSVEIENDPMLRFQVSLF